jgi:hypothetical protein
MGEPHIRHTPDASVGNPIWTRKFRADKHPVVIGPCMRLEEEVAPHEGLEPPTYRIITPNALTTELVRPVLVVAHGP